MTAQISERLIYEGQQLSMCTNPLSLYFARGGDGPNLSVAEFCVNGLFAGDCRLVQECSQTTKLTKLMSISVEHMGQ